MRPDLAAADSILVSTPDGVELKVLRLDGHAGPVVLFLHANGFHINCYAPVVSYSLPAIACQRNSPSNQYDVTRTGMANSKRRLSMLGP